MCLFGKLIVGIRVCKNKAEVSEKRKIGVVFSVVSVENKYCLNNCFVVDYSFFEYFFERDLISFFGINQAKFFVSKKYAKIVERDFTFRSILA